MEKVSFEAGERIFREGDAGDLAYVIEAGEVEISCKRDGKTILIGTVRKGEMIGEMALLDPGPRSATARCLVETRALAVRREQFENRLGQADPVLRRVIMQLIRRLREQNKIIANKG